MKHAIKYSFIVPIYNVEKYIRRCIQSIYQQTYSNFEVICINDGSTDNSLKIVQELSHQYPNLFIISQENKGLGEARNAGLQYVTGDYIWFIDSDDWIDCNSLQKLSDIILKYNQVEMIIFDCIRTNGKEEMKMDAISGEHRTFISSEDYTKSLLLYNGLFSAWAKIFRTDIYKSSKFTYSKGFFEDVSLINYYHNYISKIVYLHEPLYYYYYRDNSITRTFDNRLFDIYKQYNILCKELSYNPDLISYLHHFFIYISIILYLKIKQMPSEYKRKFYLIWKAETKKISLLQVIRIHQISFKRRLKLIYYYFSINHNSHEKY